LDFAGNFYVRRFDFKVGGVLGLVMGEVAWGFCNFDLRMQNSVLGGIAWPRQKGGMGVWWGRLIPQNKAELPPSSKIQLSMR